jgi:hypothetical protein
MLYELVAPPRSMSIPASLILRPTLPRTHHVSVRTLTGAVLISTESASLDDMDAVSLLVRRVVDLQSRGQLSVIEAQQSPPGPV